MILTKGGYHSAKFQTLNCSRKISPNLYFDKLILLKVYKISGKKIQKIFMSHNAKFEEKLICLKNDKNLMYFDSGTQKSQKFAL